MIARTVAGLIFLLVPIFAHAQGTIVVWGGSCTIPEPNEGYVDIVCSVPAQDHGYFFLALRENGSIEAWGDNTWGQCDVPEGYDDFVAIDAGVCHALALRSNGSVVVWGRSDCGVCDVPEPNIGFVAIAAGARDELYGGYAAHNLGMKADGSIVGWGDNIDGQCSIPAPNDDFIAIEAGYSTIGQFSEILVGYSFGLKSDGSIHIYGYYSGMNALLNNIPEPNLGYVDVDAAWHTAIALRGNGSIVGWGYCWGFEGSPPTPNTDFTALSYSLGNCLGLKSNGSIATWGIRNFGLPEPNEDFVKVEAGWGMCNFAIRDAEASGVLPGSASGDLPAARLTRIYPNPCNPRTTISFTLERAEWVEIGIYEMAGRRVAVLADRTFATGSHSLTWHGLDEMGREVPSGSYVVRLETETGVEVRKVSLVR